MWTRHLQSNKLLKMTKPWLKSVNILRYAYRKDGKDESDKALNEKNHLHKTLKQRCPGRERNL